MNFLYYGIIFILVNYTFSQIIPDVVLIGEPRVVARRILNVDLKTAQQLALPDDAHHIRYRVNVLDNQNLPSVESEYLTAPKTPVTVYRRILRPARITFSDERVVKNFRQGTDDVVELESWTLNKKSEVDGSFVQNQPLRR